MSYYERKRKSDMANEVDTQNRRELNHGHEVKSFYSTGEWFHLHHKTKSNIEARFNVKRECHGVSVDR